MDISLIETLVEITSHFYQTQAQSFSATRHEGWEGWDELMCIVDKSLKSQLPTQETYSILDLAAGNLRFEQVIAGKFPNLNLDVDAIDGCENLLLNSPFEFPDNITIDEHSLDIIKALIENESLSNKLHDMSCTFGFMHHVPTYELRLKTLKALLVTTKHKGIVAVSFWQFMNDEKFAQKAIHAHEQAIDDLSGKVSDLEGRLEDNDYLLGWKQKTNTYRYCHHFDDEEIDQLIEDVSPYAKVIKTYKADGKSHSMNRYIILEKTGEM